MCAYVHRYSYTRILCVQANKRYNRAGKFPINQERLKQVKALSEMARHDLLQHQRGEAGKENLNSLALDEQNESDVEYVVQLPDNEHSEIVLEMEDRGNDMDDEEMESLLSIAFSGGGECNNTFCTYHVEHVFSMERTFLYYHRGQVYFLSCIVYFSLHFREHPYDSLAFFSSPITRGQVFAASSSSSSSASLAQKHEICLYPV